MARPHYRPAEHCCVDRCSELVELANRLRVPRKSIARRLQNRSPSASHSTLQRPKNRCPEGSKCTLGGSKIEPRSPWTLRGPPGAPRERPQSVPRASQDASRAPQERPRAPQERPRAPQERPKSAQEGPKTPLKALQGALGDLPSSKKERSESDLLRDSLEKPVRIDFLSIFEACAQERTCEKPVKTHCFCRLFVSRHIFERTG